MEVKINIVEASAELAEIEVNKLYKETYPNLNEQELHTMIWQEEVIGEYKDGKITFIYTEQAQDTFSVIYDTIFDILLKAKVDD